MKRKGGFQKHVAEPFIAISPIILIAGGTLLAIAVVMTWYVNRAVTLRDIQLIAGASLAVWLGTRLDKLAIRHYNKAKRSRSRRDQYQ